MELKQPSSSSRCSAQSSRIFSIPSEVIEEIFGLIGQHDIAKYPPSSEYDAARWQARVSSLHATAVVCKSWAPLATRLLYRDVYLTSYRALLALNDTLATSVELCDLVNSFIFTGSLFSGGSSRGGSDQNVSMDASEIRRIIIGLEGSCKKLSQARFEFTWPLRRSMPELKVYANKIVSLHVTASRAFVSTFAWHTLDFRALVNLTLTGVDCATTAVCPSFLQLESLRLERCSLFNPFRHGNSAVVPTCTKLHTMELICLRDTDPEAVFSFLSRCVATLETLWIIEPSWSSGDYERLRLEAFIEIRHLGITCLPDIVHLPINLQDLIIVEAEEQVSLENSMALRNLDALEKLLIPEQTTYFRALSSVNIAKAAIIPWKKYVESLQEKCASLGITFLITYKDVIVSSPEIITDIRSTLPDPDEQSSWSGFAGIFGHLHFKKILRLLGDFVHNVFYYAQDTWQTTSNTQ